MVGAGPGDPELLTLRAVRALQSADVILFDDLVSRDVLDFARREARKLLVGKTGFGPSCKQDDINALMVSLAKQGKRVVRLKGGDPLIFGRAAEEIAACQAANIAVDVVPGITAAQGAAAKLGLPLTDRHHARRLQYVTGHAKSGKLPMDIDWQSLADPATTTAIYMPIAHAGRAGRQGHRRRPRSAHAGARHRARHAARSGVVAAPIGELPERLAQAALPGPLLVMLGRVFGEQAGAIRAVARTGQKSPAEAPASTHIVTDRHDDRDLRAGNFRRWRRHGRGPFAPATASRDRSRWSPNCVRCARYAHRRRDRH